MTKEESIIIVNFMTPGEGVLVLGRGRIVKQYFFSASFLDWGIDQTNKVNTYIVMMVKEGSTKILNFMTPMAGALMLRWGHI